MPGSINFERNLIGKDRDSAVQTALTGSTVYSLPNWKSRRSIVDLVLMIMDENGPMPMYNMRPAKKTRNAADQFYDEQQGEYEARGKPPQSQIERVHTHNNACPKMYDELNKRRSIAKVGMTGLSLDAGQVASRGTAKYASNQNVTETFDPNCPKCIKRRKRLEEDRKKKRSYRKCRGKRVRKEVRNKLDRVGKQRAYKPKKQQSGRQSTLRSSKPCTICSNKCFQCYLAVETKSVSTFKSNANLLATPIQAISPPNLTPCINIKENLDKIILNSKSSHKKQVGKKSWSLKSNENPDTETGPSVSSYNSFMSSGHEPMIE